MTNKEIVDQYLNLIDDCIFYQFQDIKDPSMLQWKEDIRQDVVVWLYEYDSEKLMDAHINNHMNALITRIIQNNIFSTTSPFYKMYRKFDLKTTEITSEMADTYGE